jgi:phage I-like protein
MAHKKSTSIIIRLALAAAGKDFVPPEWVMLFPAGRIETTDGREFRNDAPAAVIAEFERDGLVLPVDINHRSETAAPGDEAPAVGWIAALEERDGALWARVEWTPWGASLLAAREYRYISPAFYHSEDGLVLKLLSAALVTQPAIRMPALAARNSSNDKPKETGMDKKALCARLGLPQDADDDAILAAISKLKESAAMAAAGKDAPGPDAFVPRADYDHVRAELASARKALAERERKELEAAAARLVDDGVKDGKIAPASKDFWLAQASRDAEGLEQVRTFLASAPKVVPGKDAPRPDKGGDAKALTAAEKKVAAAMGIAEEDFIKTRETD